MKSLKPFYLMILALGLTGCATTLHTIPTDFVLGDKEESVVIGRVINDMGVKPIGFFDRLSTIQVEIERVGGPVLNETTGTSYIIACDKTCRDSNFFVTLPPGNYRITKIVLGQLESRPSGRFEIGKGQVIYLGTLKFVSAGIGQSILGSIAGGGQTRVVGDWRVENEYESAAKSFRERYPQMNQEIVKSLLHLE